MRYRVRRRPRHRVVVDGENLESDALFVVAIERKTERRWRVTGIADSGNDYESFVAVVLDLLLRSTPKDRRLALARRLMVVAERLARRLQRGHGGGGGRQARKSDEDGPMLD